MVAALASMLLPGAAAAVAAGTAAASSGAGLQQQDPHVSGQQQQQQQQQQSGNADLRCAPAGEGREAGVPDLAEPAAFSWGLNTSSPLPAMLLQLPQQQGSECSLRDMLQERYGSSGGLAVAAAAAAAAGCTPLEEACDGGGVGDGSGSEPAAAAAAAAAADVAERRSKRSRLAEAQPGLQQLLATPNAVLASLLANPAAAAAGAGSAGGGDEYVSCFPALTPGGWNAEGGVPGSASGTQDQQQQTTPSNMLISTQLGDGAFSVLQHLQTLLDSQQRSSSRGSGSGSGSSRNSNQLQTTGGGGAPAAAAGDALQQRRQQQQLQQELAGEGQQGALQARGIQQDESPTSPDDGLLQQGQQQGLGCLLNTPYPLLYRTTNPGTHADEKQQQQPGGGVSAPCNSSGGEAAAERGCNYKSAAAAIEDAARQSGPILQAAAMALAAAAAAAAGSGGLPPALTPSAGSVGQHF
jgi:hypothetical protein